MKWFGKIAFTDQEDDGTGIFKPIITEREYYGDLIRNSKRNENSSVINPDITLTNQLSVVADPFLLNSFHTIAYVTFAGAKWKVSSVEVNYPRLTLSFGSLYNADTIENEEDKTNA